MKNGRGMDNSRSSESRGSETVTSMREELLDSGDDDESKNPRLVRNWPREAEAQEKPRLKLDRPFLYFVRHNPYGLILHMGRFNPRLIP